ncbi:hypothetical protein P43SY_001261 [Pythium insidiosum]|uniref:Uncharacterized protein n=1 Tax=Pythium insidiosum TaxID=114742 RepID=A0AAD5Q3T9_PYTIN|nr:hypothetical protein P43SY_001261 [Pythium insidiosum]
MTPRIACTGPRWRSLATCSASGRGSRAANAAADAAAAPRSALPRDADAVPKAARNDDGDQAVADPFRHFQAFECMDDYVSATLLQYVNTPSDGPPARKKKQ